jgi:hypothetical protein
MFSWILSALNRESRRLLDLKSTLKLEGRGHFRKFDPSKTGKLITSFALGQLHHLSRSCRGFTMFYVNTVRSDSSSLHPSR